MATSTFNLLPLREALKPFRLHFFSRLRSTNDHAAALRKRGELFAPAVVLTPHQIAGRGRGANTWFSAKGSLTVTFVLPVNENFAPHHLPLAAGLAVRDAAAELAQNQNIQLKWPNDLVVQSGVPNPQSAIRNPQSAIKKLAGLLCERLDNVDLIGIGLNVNRPRKQPPKHLRDRVIYLQDIARSGPLDLNAVLATIARHLHTTLVRRSETPFPALLREYDRHHALVGRTITVLSATDPPITGKCQGLDDTGRLLVRDRKTTHPIIAGHIELARP